MSSRDEDDSMITRRDFLYHVGSGLQIVATAFFLVYSPKTVNDIIERRYKESPSEDSNDSDEHTRFLGDCERRCKSALREEYRLRRSLV